MGENFDPLNIEAHVDQSLVDFVELFDLVDDSLLEKQMGDILKEINNINYDLSISTLIYANRLM